LNSLGEEPPEEDEPPPEEDPEPDPEPEPDEEPPPDEPEEPDEPLPVAAPPEVPPEPDEPLLPDDVPEPEPELPEPDELELELESPSSELGGAGLVVTERSSSDPASPPEPLPSALSPLGGFSAGARSGWTSETASLPHAVTPPAAATRRVAVRSGGRRRERSMGTRGRSARGGTLRRSAAPSGGRRWGSR
jgi:hypothetical protein